MAVKVAECVAVAGLVIPAASIVVAAAVAVAVAVYNNRARRRDERERRRRDADPGLELALAAGMQWATQVIKNSGPAFDYNVPGSEGFPVARAPAFPPLPKEVEDLRLRVGTTHMSREVAALVRAWVQACKDFESSADTYCRWGFPPLGSAPGTPLWTRAESKVGRHFWEVMQGFAALSECYQAIHEQLEREVKDPP